MKKKQSITKNLIRYIILVVLTTNGIIFACSSYILKGTLAAQTIQSNQDLMESNIIKIDQYFDGIDNIANSIIYNTEIINVLKSKLDSSANLKILNTIESLYYHSRPDLQITFYKESAENNSYTLYKSNSFAEKESYKKSEWYRQINEKGVNRIIKTNLLSEFPEGNNKFVHSIVYRVREYYNDNTIGYIKIDMNLNELKNHFIEGYQGINGVAIFDEEDNVLFYDNKIPDISMEVFYNAANTAKTYQDRNYIMTYGTSRNTDWKIAFFVSKKELFQKLSFIWKVFVINMVLALILAIIISRKFFRIIIINFKRLLDGMEKVKTGNLTTKVEIETNDEIGQLITEFNDMVKQIDELVVNVKNKQILLNEAEMKALQQQINPHFIFNILETIMGLASEGMNQEVIDVSKCMSSMLRYNTTFQSHTRLEDEINQVKNYVHVLKLRFEDKFEVYYDIDKECLNCKIVKFTLQPLVENAITHGFRNTIKDGVLRIRVKNEGDLITISIYDNGVGIEQVKLMELNDTIQCVSNNPLDYIDQYKSLGLINVHLRLKLNFGDSYGLELFSKPNKGTCIVARIPHLET